MFCHISMVDPSVLYSQCTSRNKTRITSVPGKDQVFSYNVKVINSCMKSVFYLKPLVQKTRFYVLSDLKTCVRD